MPLYEYQCKKCAHRFEKIQKFSDKLVKKCPECGGPVEQMISAPAVQFKGSGWYVTDYGRKDSAEAKKESSGAESGASTATDGESKSKSESKSEQKKTK